VDNPTSAKVMIDKFLSYIQEQKLIIEDTSTLLAVSGGKDSMVMVDLFVQSGLPFAIGHIQHHLRGDESEDDALFVENYAQNNGVQFFRYDIDPILFDTGNMHHTARHLRYDWLRKIAHSHGYGQIATAHHKDDWRETFIIQLLRGSGLEGLSSVQPKNQNIVRPLLWASRNEIDLHADKYRIPFREDSSNAKDDYLRNQIRHHVMPAIKDADQRSFKGLDTSIQNIAESGGLFYWLLEKCKKEFVYQDGAINTILLEHLKDTGHANSLLYYLIREFGFNYNQVQDILKSEQGSIFYSHSHEAVIHQSQLIIQPKAMELGEISKTFNTLESLLNFEGSFDMSILERKSLSHFEPDMLYLDTAKIKFPVTLRPRKNGDTYTPLGMPGKSQKIKDLLINKKLSLFEKKKVVILEDSQDIIAVLPIGISDDVKITDTTQQILCIKF
jgi:tRNA(Ile)-lysidine synthase